MSYNLKFITRDETRRFGEGNAIPAFIYYLSAIVGALLALEMFFALADSSFYRMDYIYPICMIIVGLGGWALINNFMRIDDNKAALAKTGYNFLVITGAFALGMLLSAALILVVGIILAIFALRIFLGLLSGTLSPAGSSSGSSSAREVKTIDGSEVNFEYMNGDIETSDHRKFKYNGFGQGYTEVDNL